VIILTSPSPLCTTLQYPTGKQEEKMHEAITTMQRIFQGALLCRALLSIVVLRASV
jgi:hypothetical protein